MRPFAAWSAGWLGVRFGMKKTPVGIDWNVTVKAEKKMCDKSTFDLGVTFTGAFSSAACWAYRRRTSGPKAFHSAAGEKETTTAKVPMKEAYKRAHPTSLPDWFETKHHPNIKVQCTSPPPGPQKNDPSRSTPFWWVTENKSKKISTRARIEVQPRGHKKKYDPRWTFIRGGLSDTPRTFSPCQWPIAHPMALPEPFARDPLPPPLMHPFDTFA